MEIVEALESAGVRVKKHSSKENEYWICCPFCDDQRYRFGFNPVEGKAHCYNGGCEWSTRDRRYLIRELQRKLELGEINVQKGKRKKEKTEIVHPDDFELLYPQPKDYWGKKAYQYLKQRSVSNKQIREHQIGYTTTGFYRYRVIVPVIYRGKIRGYQGRTFTSSKLKYKNSTGEKVVFNVPDEKSDSIVLSEGVWDALAIERACRNISIDSGCVFGHTLTIRQLKQLRGYKAIILWMDPDKAGMEGVQAISRDLRKDDKKRKVFVVMPKDEDSDPSDLGVKVIQKRIRKARLLTEGLVLKLRNRYAGEDQ